MLDGTKIVQFFAAAVLLVASTGHAAGVDGMVVKRSIHSVAETADRLERALRDKGITVAVRWNHADRAEGTGVSLRPSELLIFGNPALGSPLMSESPTTGIDLPMKALAWEDKDGNVWLGYNAPAYLAARHGIEQNEQVLKKMEKALKALADHAVGD